MLPHSDLFIKEDNGGTNKWLINPLCGKLQESLSERLIVPIEGSYWWNLLSHLTDLVCTQSRNTLIKSAGHMKLEDAISAMGNCESQKPGKAQS